jgi:hypothetical protein
VSPMATIEERSTKYDLHAFAAPETIPEIARRITNLVNAAGGRRMAVVRRYLDSGGRSLDDFCVGLRVDRTTRKGGIDFWEQTNPVGSGFSVLLTPGLRSFGVSAYAHDIPNEKDAAHRWHERNGQQRTDVTLVVIQGGQAEGFYGRNDSIEITHYNQYAVGVQHTVRFDMVESDERARQAADDIDALIAVDLTDAALTNGLLGHLTSVLREGWWDMESAVTEAEERLRAEGDAASDPAPRRVKT